ncbi:MAG: MFS transporter [Burkholderiales bacterium RIFCSPHIGHO2_01_FULL_64_960]|nr:MAG: MFS transporter [Burkholderiales bacterium RIFCSPHIGHO2_01_FULL_64_960]OGA86000.1 MAG: MFS transporter [Burkholderiales bacterium GWA2_64_37]
MAAVSGSPLPSSSASPSFPADSGRPSPRALWAMLLALLSGFALSQAFRTTTAMVAQGLTADFGLSPGSLGAFAGLFGLSFGVAQLLMGVGLDLYGLRRTVLTAFPLAVAGSALSATAPTYPWLMAGQLLIGVGCSPAFLACTLFIARHFPADRFAYLSGVAMGVGGLGLLFTGTPLAWLVQHGGGWRTGYAVLAVLSALSWLLIWLRVHEPTPLVPPPAQRETWGQALLGFGQLLTVPHTWGILLLGMSGYAAFLSLRGLWLAPLLMDRYHLSLVDSGNVALGLSLIALFAPGLGGRLDPGIARRRRWIGNASLLMASLFMVLAFLHGSAAASVVLILLMGLLSGYGVLQYADVRASYPPTLTGRALSAYTMAMFLGVALMQWFTGIVATWAQRQGWDAYTAVMLAIATWLALASAGFRVLPVSPLVSLENKRKTRP